jgi:hypothetical protein
VETVSTAARTPGSVTVDSYGVRRGAEEVTWAELRAVRVRGDGDFVLWSRERRCVVPVKLAPGGFLEQLQALPGFDNEALVRALAGRGEAEYVCWRAAQPPRR